jgi:phage terminase large subunit-like protein
MSYIIEYANKIESGEIVVCKKIKRLYCEILRPIVEGKSKEWYLDEKAGKGFIEFCETFCCQSKGDWSGQPMKLMLFQKSKYEALFGIKSRVTKLRRFTEVLTIEGRKNGKSTENAALGLYMEMTEPGACVYVAATKFAQARLVWEEARSMVAKSPELSHYFRAKVFPAPTIQFRDSTFQALSKQTNTQDGLNVSCAIIDECHELPHSVYDILVQGTSTRRQPLISMITTAGFMREGLYDEKYDYAAKVLSGAIDDSSLLAIIYEMDDVSEIDDERMWVKANPSVGVIKKFEQLRKFVNQAKGDPTFRNTVLTKDFNVLGVRNEAWLEPSIIINDEAYGEEDLQKTFLYGHAIGGFDLSRTNDLTAFTTMLFDSAKKKIVVLTMYWMTDDFLKSPEAKASGAPWDSWIQRGLIRVSGEHAIRTTQLADYMEEIRKAYKITYSKVDYDAWSAPELIDELARRGYMRDVVLVPVRQGFKTMSIPMQKMETLLREKNLVYQANPVTRWMLSNIQLEQDSNGNMMPKKAGEKRANKIDGPSTILDCLVSYCESPTVFMPQ